MGLELLVSSTIRSIMKCIEQVLAQVKEVLGRSLNHWRLDEAARALWSVFLLTGMERAGFLQICW